jgi:hypothetical protein
MCFLLATTEKNFARIRYSPEFIVCISVATISVVSGTETPDALMKINVLKIYKKRFRNFRCQFAFYLMQMQRLYANILCRCRLSPFQGAFYE